MRHPIDGRGLVRPSRGNKVVLYWPSSRSSTHRRDGRRGKGQFGCGKTGVHPLRSEWTCGEMAEWLKPWSVGEGTGSRPTDLKSVWWRGANKRTPSHVQDSERPGHCGRECLVAYCEHGMGDRNGRLALVDGGMVGAWAKDRTGRRV